MTIRCYQLNEQPSVPPMALVREVHDFGLCSLDLAMPPSRFFGGRSPAPAVRIGVDAARVALHASLGEVLAAPPVEETTMGQTRRALGQLFAWFLIAEDPQRRLDAKPVATLAHQASLVRHVLSQPALRNVMIADEVGLGKTVEVGLIIKELWEASPHLRVLYLAPAGLVRNVHVELQRLGLPFRLWISGSERDARLSDPMVLASIHRAVHPTHFQGFVDQVHWDVIVVDECHHLSDWQRGGGKPTRKYRLVNELRARQPHDSRLILMSGTPHQGHPDRFENLLALLKRQGETREDLAGRVIYRTKDDVKDWDGRPLFPRRSVKPPMIIDLGPEHRAWLEQIYRTFRTETDDSSRQESLSQPRRRALNWRCGQALQWATSSVEAGLGFLVRQAIRAGWELEPGPLWDAAAALRPYRQGTAAEPVPALFARISREIGDHSAESETEDLEQEPGDELGPSEWRPDRAQLSTALAHGVALLASSADTRWEALRERILSQVPKEKVVMFAQPIETVTALCNYLTRTYGERPAVIVGGQSHEQRAAQVEAFWSPHGPRFLVSSRAGGEGLNLQVARVLVHLDVPWNPMELEQRVGRVHRFMSRKTIEVHTTLVPDSREAHMYELARHKLRSIARTLAPERFEDLFVRVMALVPPEELSEVLVRDGVGPLGLADQDELARLVAEGYSRWERFDREFSGAQQRIREVPAGHAHWNDLSRFAREYADARVVAGGTAHRFRQQHDDVVEDLEPAQLLELGGKIFASEDYGSVPVSTASGDRASPLGLNQETITATLRDCAFGSGSPGVAHLRLGRLDDLALEPPFGLLVYGRVNLSLESAAHREVAVELRMFAVTPAGELFEVEEASRGQLVRALLEAQVIRQRDATLFPLAAHMARVDGEVEGALRRPANSTTRHAVFPVAAVIATAT